MTNIHGEFGKCAFYESKSTIGARESAIGESKSAI